MITALRGRLKASLICAVVAACLVALPAARSAPSILPPVHEHAQAALENVERAFARLGGAGEFFAASAGNLIPRPAYRNSFSNGFGYDNHFQGIQRLGTSDVLALSGADAAASAADLFLVDLGAGPARFIASFTLDDQAWHAGGISEGASILAVPFYDSGGSGRQSRVRFYDVSDPYWPRQLPITIERAGRKAIAVALTRLGNQHWLVAVLSGRDGDPRRLDFYLSRTVDLLDGFGPPVGWPTAYVRARNGEAPSFSHFQNINFLAQTDGRLYLVGFHNTFVNLSALPGRDYADLYEIVLPASVTRAEQPAIDYPFVVKVANRRLGCRDGYCSFDAAAGAHVDPRSGLLSIYAAPGWIDGNDLKLARFGESSRAAGSSGRRR